MDNPADPETGSLEASLETPRGYELLDFDTGRKLPLKVSDIYRRLTT